MSLNLIDWIIVYIAPLSGLFVGILILVFVAYINWFGNVKERTTKWIAQKIYRNSLGSEAMADGLFMTVTSVLLAAGGILVIYSLLFF